MTTASETPKARTVDMKFEIVVVPVSDIDRAKRFYGGLGWRLDADFAAGDDFRVIQFTPPGSGCSVIFGKNVTAAAPGSAQGLYLIVSDIKAARDELLGRGVEISEVFHGAGDAYVGTDEPYLFGRVRVSGPDSEHRSYRSFASFKDPDGNGWLFQEVTARLPGRVDADDTTFTSSTELAAALRRAASTRSGPAASTMRTGRTGTPSTSSGSRPARSCRHEPRLRRHRLPRCLWRESRVRHSKLLRSDRPVNIRILPALHIL
jgi:catechol 2,3-dioxygenase-like lactoylglutathione lyase family enzyme